MSGNYVLIHICVWITFTTLSRASLPCKEQMFPNGDTPVCVCNATYCDTVDNYEPLKKGYFTVYTSSNSTGDRLTMRSFQSSNTSNATASTVTFTINKKAKYQTVLGFGGATTDSTAINAFNLSAGTRKNLINSYFAQDGLEYTMTRVTMGCSDFSVRYYTLDDVEGDFNLTHFALADEDLKYKIPFLQEAKSVSRRGIKMYGSPWTPPKWMKTNQDYRGAGQIIGYPGEKYYKTWANYFVRFLQEYKKHNMTYWGMTVQNEPFAGGIEGYAVPSCFFTPEMERDFVKLDLGPAMHSNGFQDIKLMMLDDQRWEVPGWPSTVLGDEEAAKYISGIGIHWYWDQTSPLLKLDLTNANFPSYFMLYTESCFRAVVTLGLWEQGERYSTDIINNMNHWVTGWVDWSMLLDMSGGPTFVGDTLQGTVIADTEKDVFYKQPMFYHLGHFSKFVIPGSRRVNHTEDKDSSLLSIMFQQPDGHTNVAVLLNTENEAVSITIADPGVGYINSVIPARSIQTYLWTDA